jgi:hypothetical protein
MWCCGRRHAGKNAPCVGVVATVVVVVKGQWTFEYGLVVVGVTSSLLGVLLPHRLSMDGGACT